MFSAREQKHWYEVLGFNFASAAIRCLRCRRKRRSDKALHHAVEDAKRAVSESPKNAGAQLALAEALVSLHERIGHGRLEEAIAAARKAQALLPPAEGRARALACYWEARAQERSGRGAKAKERFEAFLEHASKGSHRAQIRHARASIEAWIEAHPEAARESS